jgi:hypothetical protein
MAIDFSYTPGSANSLAASYNAAEQTRNQLAQQARANEIGDYQLNSLKRADTERTAVADAWRNAVDAATGSVDQAKLFSNLSILRTLCSKLSL